MKNPASESVSEQQCDEALSLRRKGSSVLSCWFGCRVSLIKSYHVKFMRWGQQSMRSSRLRHNKENTCNAAAAFT